MQTDLVFIGISTNKNIVPTAALIKARRKKQKASVQMPNELVTKMNGSRSKAKLLQKI